MGLLLPHKRTLSIYPDMFTLSVPCEGERKGGGKRGEIQVFSAESRYRLFKLLHCLEFKRVTFVTLTYPSSFPSEAKIYKAHLKEWRRRIERLYGPLRAVWRLEFQKRGAPHFHIMYLDAPFLSGQHLSGLWADVTRSEDEDHRKIGVDVKLVTDSEEGKLIASYLAKYVAKLDTGSAYHGSIKPGRWWGKWNIKDPDPITVEISDREAGDLTAIALCGRTGNQKWVPADPTICTIFGGNMGSGEFAGFVTRAVRQVAGDRGTGKARHKP